MKVMKHISLILSLLIILAVKPADIYAQKNFSQQADRAYEEERYFVAIDMYKNAYNKVKNKTEKARILFRIAECYRMTNNTRQASNWYPRAVKAGYPDPIATLYSADMLKIEEKYPEAIIKYQEYQQLVPEDNRGQNGIESCELAQKWIDDPTRYVVENMKKFNSRSSDFSPYWADKKFKVIFFTSTREGSVGNGTDDWTGQSYSDLYFTVLDKKGAWSEPEPLDESVNTIYNEGTPWLNDRANLMFFTRCPIIKKQSLGCQIYYAKKQGRGWASADTLLLAPDLSYAVGHPTLSSDELTIVFSSDMPGGYGGKDLWVATRPKKTKPFEPPVNLGPNINTDGDEMFPYLRNDGTLFYSSNSHKLLGMGGLDIYKSEKTGENKWGKPENMKSPINSPADDFGIIYKADKEEGFLSSNRKGGRGDDDIWAFSLPPLVFTLQGTVRDDSTKQLIIGALVVLKGSDGTIIEDSTDETGMYHFGKTQILENTSYELIVSKPKYYSTKGRETTVGLKKSKDLVHDFNLVPIPPVPIVLPDVLYDLGKWDITEQGKDSLDWLVNILKENPTWVIELSSHTDIRPIPMTNDTLSLRRAVSAIEYITSQGIYGGRMVAQGYGAHRPRVLDRDKNVILPDQPKYAACKGQSYFFAKGAEMSEKFINSLKTYCEKEAAHQLNRRTEFIVLREDFVPPPSNDSVGNVVVVINPNDNVVTILPGVAGSFEGMCIINKVSVDFKYDGAEDKMFIDAEIIMKQINTQRITVNDFKDKEKAFNEDGSLVENSVVNLKVMTIGKKTLNNVEAVVVYGQNPPILLGTKVLSKFGDYIVVEEKRQLIFDPKPEQIPKDDDEFIDNE